ncbi:MAG: endonuclease/exonuclease/phosphatase family protein [Nanoarchaeota archaeon]|nr:endonuclease/exonuclease/phosphatase family protein [Nanoarchaeota archaeon]
MPLIQVPEITLRVLSLNMQFGAGPESKEGKFLLHFPPQEQDHNLDNIVNLIEEVDPHIICLQEVEFGSSRTGFVNQAQEIVQRLAKKQEREPYHLETGTCLEFDEKRFRRIWELARYLYGEERSQWIFRKLDIDKQELPKEKIKIDFGNAILSRYPLKDKTHHFFTPPYSRLLMDINIIRRKDERKSLLICRVDYHPEIAEKVPLFVYNTHLENKDPENRKRQSKILYDQLSQRNNVHKILAIDGNAEPLGEDYDLESGSQDESLERLLRHPEMRFFPGIYPRPDKEPARRFATYPSHQPAQVLDTTLTSKYVEIVNYRVHPARVSDHLAVIADIKINADLVRENILKQLVNPLVENP